MFGLYYIPSVMAEIRYAGGDQFGWLLRETTSRLVLDTEGLIFATPITTLEE